MKNDFGHFNELPQGFAIVNEEEFYDRFFMYCINGEIFRQPRNTDPELLLDGELFVNIRMFPLDYADCHDLGCGIGLVWHTKSMSKRVVFFKFGSNEKWQSLGYKMAALNSSDNS